MLTDEPPPCEELLPVLESKEVVEEALVPSFEEALDSEVRGTEVTVEEEQDKVLETVLGGGFEVQAEGEDVCEEPPVTPMMAKAAPFWIVLLRPLWLL